MKIIIPFCLTVLFSGCATLEKLYENPYKKFYSPNSENINKVTYLEKGEQPAIYQGLYLNGYKFKGDDIGDIKADLDGLYVPIGTSSFRSNYFKNTKGLMKFSKELGASVALDKSELLDRNSSYVPSTTTTTHSGTVDNSSYSGTSTTQSNKLITTTTYNHFVTFYAKAINPKETIGVALEELNKTAKAASSRNTGALVFGIRNKSPAFYANLIKNDVIIKVNNQETVDVPMTLNLIENAINDNTIKLTIIRHGMKKNIIVKMNK